MSQELLRTADRAALSASLGESHFREFKSALHGPAGSKTDRPIRDICRDIGEALVAFANADGGELLVGVEDASDVSGLGGLNQTDIAALLNAPKTHVHPTTPLASVAASKTAIAGIPVLYFAVPKSQGTIHLTSDGRCLQRRDLETIPVAPTKIQSDRQELRSREYDRGYVDGTSLADLNTKVLQAVADQISRGMSPEKCLQYLGLADYDANVGLRLRRAALLLFAQNPARHHPRLQVRILRVAGIELETGTNYNVTADDTVTGTVMSLLVDAWEALRVHLVQTKLGGSALFEAKLIYPEHACREALVNAIAHRDYSDEGRGIEVYVFDDRIELRNPGALLPTISLADLRKMSGAHESRNSYVSRTLREVGYMRELGEGMRRIFELMKSNELESPKIESGEGRFAITFFHRPMYAQDELLWLDQYTAMDLSPEQKAIALLGRKGSLIAPQDIWDRLGIVDTEHYRQLVHSLQNLGILKTEVPKARAQNLARQRKVGVKQIPRFKIALAKDIERTARPTPTPESTKPTTPIPVERSSIYVGNLPPNVNDRDMVTAFEPYGSIARVTIPRTGGHSRGYGFVEFESKENADQLLAQQPKIRMGPYQLVLRPALPQIRPDH